jgi:hypothetical protein
MEGLESTSGRAKTRSYLQTTRAKRSEGMAQARVECLPSKCKALSTNVTTTKKKKKEEERKKKKKTDNKYRHPRITF